MAENTITTATHRPAKSSFWKAIAAVAWKDLAAELRSRELLSAMLVFSFLVILEASRGTPTRTICSWYRTRNLLQDSWLQMGCRSRNEMDVGIYWNALGLK